MVNGFCAEKEEVGTSNPFLRKRIAYLQQLATQVGTIFHIETGNAAIVQVQVIARQTGEYHCRYPLHAMLSPVYLPKHSVRLNRSTVLW